MSGEQTNNSPNQVYCPSCRGGNPPVARHCQWCGISLSQPQPPVYSVEQINQDQQPAQQKSGSGCLTALSTFLIGSVFLLISVYIQSLFASNNTTPRSATPLPFPTVVSNIEPTPDKDELLAVQKAAMAGDYQAQRNHAFALSEGYDGVKNPIAACAWRLVIIRSGHPEINSSDYTNQNFYCNKAIRPVEKEEAEKMAEQLLAEIEAK